MGNIRLKGAKPADIISVEFPISEKTVTLKSFGHEYQAVFKGSTCVDIEPKGHYYPLFLREHYRSNRPRFVKVRRFVCDNPIRW